MLGCDYHCGYCQNWLTSQALRDPEAGRRPIPTLAGGPRADRPRLRRRGRHQHLQRAADHQRMGGRGLQGREAVRPGDLVRLQRQRHARGARRTSGPGSTSTRSTSRASTTGSTGSSAACSTGARDDPRPPRTRLLGRDRHARRARVQRLRTPSSGRSPRFIASVSPDIPWHVTAFHPDYKMTDARHHVRPTPSCGRAEIGREAGLHFVYAGNLPGLVGRFREHLLPVLFGCH